MTGGIGGRVAGKVVLVTGGGGGLGAAYAGALAAEGAHVVVADVDVARAERVAVDCGPDAVAQALDVADEGSWEAAAKAVAERWGHLDALVNNAGTVHRAPLIETTAADFRRVLDVNTVGTFLGIRTAAGLMPDGGSIVNVSSTAGTTGLGGIIGYTASKWAVRGMTRAAAVELAHLGIRVNTLVPGLVRTPMTAGFTGPGGSLRGRMGEVGEVAPLVVFLVSDESAFCTGSDFVADGGETATVRPPAPVHRPSPEEEP
jgi:3alpha(or 20beta)-hydroxysteroid dehydrogenase